MQIMNQGGLLPYPNADFGSQVQNMTDNIVSFMKMKKDVENEKATKSLEMYLKTGEILGDFEAATPEIQSAFKRVTGAEPQGIFKTGGKTLKGREAEASIKEKEASTEKTKNMGDWYARRTVADGSGKVNQKAMTSAISFANSKLGKPFEVLTDDERGLWQTYHDEGLAEFYRLNGTDVPKAGGTVPGGKKATYTSEQQSFINAMKALPKAELNRLTDKKVQGKFNSKLQMLGLSREDIF